VRTLARMICGLFLELYRALIVLIEDILIQWISLASKSFFAQMRYGK
jgi:hypothetical protein